MGIPVDPFQQPIPPALQQDPEVRSYFEFLAKFNHDMWLRSGGGIGVIPEFLIEVAKGNVPGTILTSVIGGNFDVDVGTSEDVWTPGGQLVYPTSGEAWEIVSDNANDTAAGTGARQVFIQYLDTDYKIQNETVILNGTTPVPLVGTDAFRPEVTVVTAVGSTGFNEGKIDIRRISDGLLRSQIWWDAVAGGENVSSGTHFTIPAKKSGYLVGVYPTIGKNKDIILRMKNTDGDDGVFVTAFGLGMYEQTVPASLTTPGQKMPEKTDVKFVCETENNNSNVGVNFQLLLVDD